MKLLQTLFFFLMPLFLFSQTKKINVELKFQEGYGPFEHIINWPVIWEDSSNAVKNTYPDFRGIPANLKDIKRGIIWFDAQQYVYQNYINGKITRENFLKLKNNVRNKFDGKVLSKTIIKCFVSLLSATNEKNENIYFIDVNNNYDFSDDVPLHPADSRKSDKDLNQHLVSVMCQRILNGEIISERVPLLIVKKGNSLLYSIAQYATGSFSTRKKNYELAVCPLYFYGRTWKQTQILLLNDSLKSKKVRKDLIVNTDGFITIGNSIYKFNGVDISKNTLILKKVSNNNEYSSQVGFHAPLFKSKDILTGTNVSLASYKGKYILIDFWGTWCHPCREQLPTLVKLNNSVDSSRFVLISIATMDSVANLKKVISQENMTWPQLFSDQITRQYNVSAFPTSLLIDPNGIVIARDLSMEDLMQRLSKLALLN